jgi:hypothetical protein
LAGNDIFIDDGSGSLNSNLSGLTGWSGIPANIRQGYNTRTLSAGNKWISSSSPTSTSIESIALVDANNGWAVGFSGLILKLSNGTWSVVASPTTERLRGLDVIDIDTGWAVGSSGTILQLSSGTWSTVTSPSSQVLFSVSLADANNGWAVSNTGETLKLSSGTWSKITSPVSDSLRQVRITDIDTGWAVGTNGRIIQLSSGSWSIAASPTSDNLESLDIVDANTGNAVGGNGTILQLSSGTWSTVTSPTTDNLFSVSLASASSGYAMGTGGIILELSSGTWSPITSPTNNLLLAADVIATESGWAVGQSGAIINLVSPATTGTDKSRRIGWFYVDYDGSAYSVANYDGSSFNYIVTELLNAEDQTGTRKWIKWYPFTDSNGYPTSINYDLGGGAQDYCAWGVEYQNENTNGYLQNQKLVLIRDFTYPASPDDTITATVDDLLALTSVNVDQSEYSVVRIITNSSIVQNAVYNADLANNKPDYDSLITVEETALTTDITNTILSNHWCEGGILGEGGSGSTDGAGAIDNIRFLTL